uniref:Uncharacterized protein n=1 Tax=Arundo donax TaxID=35708 RepID=A0A0A9AGW7_ARUDO
MQPKMNKIIVGKEILNYA